MQLTWAIRHEIERTARLVWDSDAALHSRYSDCGHFQNEAVRVGEELAMAHTLSLGHSEIIELGKHAPPDFQFVAVDLLQSQVNAAKARAAAR